MRFGNGKSGARARIEREQNPERLFIVIAGQKARSAVFVSNDPAIHGADGHRLAG